jgi:hypothetical protein
MSGLWSLFLFETLDARGLESIGCTVLLCDLLDIPQGRLRILIRYVLPKESRTHSSESMSST